MKNKSTKDMNTDELRIYLEKELPPIIARKAIPHYTGGLYSIATMSCADSRGNGPEDAYQSEDREVFYIKDKFIEWITNRCKKKDVKKRN